MKKTDSIIMTGDSANFADALHSGRFSTARLWIGPSLDWPTPKSKVTAFLWCNSLPQADFPSLYSYSRTTLIFFLNNFQSRRTIFVIDILSKLQFLSFKTLHL
jgi:hypothetical protein